MLHSALINVMVKAARRAGRSLKRDLGEVNVVVERPCEFRHHGGQASYLDAAMKSLAPHLDRECLIVGKSTVSIGAAQRLADKLARLAPIGAGAELAWNPSSSGRASR